jgi:Flp pilus assembly pilin Flp
MWRRGFPASALSAPTSVVLFLRDDRGGDIVEYALLAGFVAACVLVLHDSMSDFLDVFTSLKNVLATKLP